MVIYLSLRVNPAADGIFLAPTLTGICFGTIENK